MLRILCITSFSAFPTKLNQQVTSANLSEIGVMQRFLNRLLKYWFARMRPRTSTAQNRLQAIILSLVRGGAPSKLSFFESSDSISAAC